MMSFSKPTVFWAVCGIALAFTPLTSACHAQDWAKTRLEQSPRHREYVSVKRDGRDIQTYVVYPEMKGKAPVVVLIHEIFGLTDWMKLEADEVAAKGYIVVAPDLLSGSGPNGGGSDALYASPGGQDAVIKGVMGLDSTQVNLDLDAVTNYGKNLSAASGKVIVGGFCWGGSASFEFATHRPDLSAALVFYGTPPKTAELTKIHAPIYGFYAENDARVSSTISAATTEMKAAGKTYEPVTYAGAGHGFMRAGQAPDASDANKKAYDEGSVRMFQILAKIK